MSDFLSDQDWADAELDLRQLFEEVPAQSGFLSAPSPVSGLPPDCVLSEEEKADMEEAREEFLKEGPEDWRVTTDSSVMVSGIVYGTQPQDRGSGLPPASGPVASPVLMEPNLFEALEKYKDADAGRADLNKRQCQGFKKETGDDKWWDPEVVESMRCDAFGNPGDAATFKIQHYLFGESSGEERHLPSLEEHSGSGGGIALPPLEDCVAGGSGSNTRNNSGPDPVMKGKPDKKLEDCAGSGYESGNHSGPDPLLEEAQDGRREDGVRQTDAGSGSGNHSGQTFHEMQPGAKRASEEDAHGDKKRQCQGVPGVDFDLNKCVDAEVGESLSQSLGESLGLDSYGNSCDDEMFSMQELQPVEPVELVAGISGSDTTGNNSGWTVMKGAPADGAGSGYESGAHSGPDQLLGRREDGVRRTSGPEVNSPLTPITLYTILAYSKSLGKITEEGLEHVYNTIMNRVNRGGLPAATPPKGERNVGDQFLMVKREVDAHLPPITEETYFVSRNSGEMRKEEGALSKKLWFKMKMTSCKPSSVLRFIERTYGKHSAMEIKVSCHGHKIQSQFLEVLAYTVGDSQHMLPVYLLLHNSAFHRSGSRKLACLMVSEAKQLGIRVTAINSDDPFQKAVWADTSYNDSKKLRTHVQGSVGGRVNLPVLWPQDWHSLIIKELTPLLLKLTHAMIARRMRSDLKEAVFKSMELQKLPSEWEGRSSKFKKEMFIYRQATHSYPIISSACRCNSKVRYLWNAFVMACRYLEFTPRFRRAVDECVDMAAVHRRMEQWAEEEFGSLALNGLFQQMNALRAYQSKDFKNGPAERMFSEMEYNVDNEKPLTEAFRQYQHQVMMQATPAAPHFNVTTDESCSENLFYYDGKICIIDDLQSGTISYSVVKIEPVSYVNLEGTVHSTTVELRRFLIFRAKKNNTGEYSEKPRWPLERESGKNKPIPITSIEGKVIIGNGMHLSVVLLENLNFMY